MPSDNPKTLEQLYWDQEALVQLVKQRQVTYEQVMAVVEGELVEILFDMMQMTTHFRSRSQITCKPLSHQFLAPRLVFIQPQRVWQQAGKAWLVWQQAGLAAWSPNAAPVIWDREELRRQTSLLIYHNLTTLANGDRTLRDLAVKLKQPVASLTQSLLPYVQKEIMGLVNIGDLIDGRAEAIPVPQSALAPPSSVNPVTVRSASPLVAYIEDSRFDSIAMSQILAEAGCRFVNIQDPIQALPVLLEQKPDLIFLDLLMPVTNGYEVCAQIRRVSALKETPIIIVTSSDGIVDRVRAKLAGSSGFIAKPIEPEQVLGILRGYLPRD
ncbi:MAG: hypothetical protein Kow00121_64040 [Elainellaceae cyanobacterium]